MKKFFFSLFVFLSFITSYSQSIFDTTVLRTRINDQIKTNSLGQITGLQLNQILNGYLNTLKRPYDWALQPSKPVYGYSELTGLPLLNLANWNSSFSWGNHAGLYRPLSYVPTWAEITSKPLFFDGNYNSLTNLPLLNIPNWNTAYSWGNHTGLYRPLSYVPTWAEITSKPLFFDGNYNSLTNLPSLSIVNWNSAFSWGNHAGLYRPLSYVPTWAEITSKPLFFDGNYNSLTNLPLLNIPNWNTAYSWGNHTGLYRPLSYVPTWAEITSKPLFFDGNYNSLTNLPSLSIVNWNSAFSWGNHAGLYRPLSYVPTWAEITSKPLFFDGNYNTLTNKPIFLDLTFGRGFNSAIYNTQNSVTATLDTTKNYTWLGKNTFYDTLVTNTKFKFKNSNISDALLKKDLDNKFILSNQIYSSGGIGNSINLTRTSSQYINIPTNFLTTNLSISFWFKTKTSGSHRFFELGSASSQYTMTLEFNSLNNLVTVAHYNTGTPSTITTSLNYVDNNWHHVVYTPTSLYIDNIKYTFPIYSFDTNVFNFGMGSLLYTGTTYSDAITDQLLVYNTTLTDANVSSLYNFGSGLSISSLPLTNNIVRSYDFEESVLGSPIVDNNPFNVKYNATAFNSPTYSGVGNGKTPTIGTLITTNVIESSNGQTNSEYAINTFGDISSRAVIKGLWLQYQQNGKVPLRSNNNGQFQLNTLNTVVNDIPIIGANNGLEIGSALSIGNANLGISAPSNGLIVQGSTLINTNVSDGISKLETIGNVRNVGNNTASQMVHGAWYPNMTGFTGTQTIGGTSTTYLHKINVSEVWTMETALGHNRYSIIRKVGTGTITLNLQPSQFIIKKDGTTVTTLAITEALGAVHLQSDGVNTYYEL